MEQSDPKRAVTPSVRPTAVSANAPSPSLSVSKNRPGPEPLTGPARPWLIRKRGSNEVLRCADLLVLRSWMLERRVSRDDEISRSGKVYRRLGSVVEFESLFHSVDVERAARRRPLGTPAPIAPLPAANSARSGTPPPIPGLAPPASSALPARAEATASPDRVQVTPPNLTPTSGTMSPLRITPSGQMARSRPAPSTTATPTPPVPPAPLISASAASGPPPVPPHSGSAPLVPIRPAPLAAQAEPVRPTPTAKQAEPVRPAPPPLAVPPRKEPPVPPPPVVLSPQVSDSNDETAALPTTRFNRLEPAKPVPPTPPPGPPPKTAPFERMPSAEPPKDSPDLISAKRTELLPAKVVDPIEKALSQNDPVPRHLKEAADPNRTARIHIASDPTDRFERKDSRRGLVLFLGALGITGVLVFALQQASKPDLPKPSGQESATAPDPNSLRNGNPPTTPPSEIPAGDTPKPTSPPPVAATPSVPQVKPPPAPPLTAPTATTPAQKPVVPAPSQTSTVQTAKPPTTPPAQAQTNTAQTAKPPTTPPASAPAQTASASSEKSQTATPAVKKPVVSEIPKTFDEQMELAQRLIEREQFGEAQRLLETIIVSAAHVPAVHVGLGKCALEQGHADEAISHYQDALSRLSTYGPAMFGMAKSYRQKGDKDQAIHWYKKYLEQNPNGGAAAVAREAIAKLEGHPAPAASELVKPPAATKPSSELVKP